MRGGALLGWPGPANTTGECPTLLAVDNLQPVNAPLFWLWTSLVYDDRCRSFDIQPLFQEGSAYDFEYAFVWD